MEEVDTVPLGTQCPEPAYRYFKQKAVIERKTVKALFAEVLEQFLEERPWAHGMKWRVPRRTVWADKGNRGSTGWVQIRIEVPRAIGERVQRLSDALDISRACIFYTSFFWFVQYKQPPTGA